MNPLALGLGAVIDSVGKIAGDLYTSDKERMELDLKARELDQASDARQVTVNAAEAATGNMFIGGWRPATGWTCVAGLAYQTIVQPVVPWVLTVVGVANVPALPPIDGDTLMVLLFGLLGLGGLRTVERVRGKA
ncbi:MAG: 3TM-type holin [Polymorphobacter sp.]